MKKITQEELDQILQQHQLWLGSDGVNGERANLHGADLQGANLHGVDLQDANLHLAITIQAK